MSKQQIIESLEWRYACKKFDAAQKLSEEKVTILKDSFNLTATSYGLQPLKMVVISNAAIKRQLPQYTMEQQQVADASHVLVLCTELEISSTYIKTYFEQVAQTRNTPEHVLQPFEEFLVESFSKKQMTEVSTWMAKQAYIALGNLLTVCALAKIDACPIEGFEPAKYDEFLNLTEKGLRSVLVLAVGHRAKDDMHANLKKVRRGVERVIIEM